MEVKPFSSPFLIFFQENSSKPVISATASYYTGGALSDSSVNWNVRHCITKYTPPKFSEFSFGVPTHKLTWEEQTYKYQVKYEKGITDKVMREILIYIF